MGIAPSNARRRLDETVKDSKVHSTFRNQTGRQSVSARPARQWGQVQNRREITGKSLQILCPGSSKKLPTWQFPMLATLSIKSRAVFISACVGCPFTAQKTSGGRGFIGPAISNDFYVFKLVYPVNQCFEFLLFQEQARFVRLLDLCRLSPDQYASNIAG